MLSKVVLCLCLVAYVSAHSMLLCFDNGGLTVDKLTLASGKNPCNAYPRGRIKFDEQGDGFTNRPGSVCGTDFGTAYPSKYPAATIAAGANFYPEWAGRNHAGTPNAGNVQFFMSKVNPTADPAQSEFNSNLICDISYSNCNQALGSNDAPCTGVCTIPASTAPGKYVVQWWWEFNPGELYSNCADITVTAGTGGTPSTPSTPSNSPSTPSNSPSTPSNSPSNTPIFNTPTKCAKDSDCASTGICRITGVCVLPTDVTCGAGTQPVFTISTTRAVSSQSNVSEIITSSGSKVLAFVAPILLVIVALL
eukprot:TRINITY_DN773_c0_g1_i1.p1 TRINITY_DN773_c0_g1~~TRINITY_DN773_c0_g1_i1.p1  ORF type:complete len:307 (+),score=44.87 TRINITY_DN773_c0_g1_i1:79-999(+)